jgi:hypothetical protein
MRRFGLAIAVLPLLAVPAAAQGYQGNWGCLDTQATRAGILTIYGSVYGFASTTFGDTASGTGTLTPYTDGAGINDGPLRTARGIEAARLVSDPTTGVAVQLESSAGVLMLCTPR